MENTAISIRLNGQSRDLPSEEQEVAALLAGLGFAGQPVLVELNGTALFPRDFQTTRLQAGDIVEIIRIVAGG